MLGRSRWAVTALAAGVPLLLAACGASAPAGGARPRVAFVIANTKLNFASEMAAGFRAGVGDVGGVDVAVDGPPIVDGLHELRIFNRPLGQAR